MLTLRRMAEAESSALCAWVIPEDQRMFVDPISEVLDQFAASRIAYVAAEILGKTDVTARDAGSSPVAFFQIDPAPETPQKPGFIELRNFFVSPQAQGRGVGTAACAALPSFLPRKFPEARGVALTVNCRNAAAYRVYEKAGFIDTGELYEGGRSGPQHVMLIPFGAP